MPLRALMHSGSFAGSKSELNDASLSPEDSVWLKIDTQGYEREVLKGASRLMPRVRALECELSLVPLYDVSL